MKHSGRWMAVALLAACLGTSGCRDTAAGPPDTSEPVKVETLDANQVRLTLTEEAANRLGIQTGTISEASARSGSGSSQRKVMPYAALFYDADGRPRHTPCPPR